MLTYRGEAAWGRAAAFLMLVFMLFSAANAFAAVGAGETRGVT